MTNGRDECGRFAPGCAGGPGRPRRAIEREYLAALGEGVSLVDWREVVSRALADAKAGDHPAKDWLSRYLVGDRPMVAVEQNLSSGWVGAAIDELHNEPNYIEWLRERALAEDTQKQG